MIIGMKSIFFTDVKSPISAGMQFTYNKGGLKGYKCKCIGYDLIRIYFDTKEKDYTIGEERIKRVINQ